MIILIDGDGTCWGHEFPRMGKDVGATPVLKKLIENGHQLILFTMRSDFNGAKYLTDAVNWFKNNDIPLYGIQENPTQKAWTSSPKALGDLIIDDTCIFAPLKIDLAISSRPFIDWVKVEEELIKLNLI